MLAGEICTAGYAAIENRKFSGFVKPDYRDELEALSPAITLRQFPCTRVIKDRPKIAAGIVGEAFFKHYKPRGWFYALRHIFLTPRPLISLRGALHLRQNGIPTPEVRAAIIYKCGGIPQDSLLITDSLLDEDLQCDHLIGEFAKPENYPSMVNGLADLLNRMHNCGFRHGDLNLRNLYCRRSAIGFSGWGVIDLDSCTVSHKPLNLKLRTLDMARLIAAMIQCARGRNTAMPETMKDDFLQKYQELSGFDLSGKFMDKRITYHVERIRRNH